MRVGVPHFTSFLPVLLSTLLLSSCGPIWRSPSYYIDYPEMALSQPIMTSEEYGKVIGTHARPYVVQYDGAKGAVLLFGAEHTRVPTNPQIQQIKEAWTKFNPTTALVEGRLGFLFRWFMNPITEFGESGLVLDLAKEKGIDCFTWEPPFEKEIGAQLRWFPAQRVALFYVLRPYFSAYRFGKPDDTDGFIEEYRSTRTKLAGLENTLPSVTTIDSMWRTDFPDAKDWRETSDEHGYAGYLQEIFVQSNLFRDEHFVRVMIHLVSKGERVFAIAGSAHAVKLDSTLRAAVAEPR